MRIREEYVITEIRGVKYLLPYGQGNAQHLPAIQLNEISTEMLKHFMGRVFYEADCIQFMQELGVENEVQAKEDVTSFLDSLIQKDVIYDETLSFAKIQPDSFFEIGGVGIAFSGPDTYLSSELEDFRKDDLNYADLRFSCINERPHNKCGGTIRIHTDEIVIYEEEKTYGYVYLQNAFVREMKVKKDGTAATVYIYSTDKKTDAIKNEVFMALRQSFSIIAQSKNMFLMHSASVVYNEKAYLFSGQSGTGKSTHAKLWEKEFGVEQWNGDLNLLEIVDGVAYVHGIPWHGTSGIYHNGSLPLGGITFLRQSDKDAIVSKSDDQMAIFALQRLISPAYTEELLERNLSFCKELVSVLPMWRLECTKETTAARLMKDTIDELR